jgi:hypothetical protein
MFDKNKPGGKGMEYARIIQKSEFIFSAGSPAP